ncbi:glucoamylase family protein [Phycicoccus avicenniae]|uniref:glucoamylase family protein n=1 Tax=Phycicoccus avicenniae TaxID=2828860 RepID=UPI003D2CA9C4
MPDADLPARWARDTWRCLDAATDERTGLPADWLAADLDPATRSGYTSPTNIGGLLWSTVAARDLGLVTGEECRNRCTATLSTLERLERHEPSGMLANWYSEATGELLLEMPDGGPVLPFMSSVDNGWLAAGLLVVEGAVPELAADARRLRVRMDFGAFHDAAAGPAGPGGRLRGGFWPEDPGHPTVLASYSSGPPVHHTVHHYDLLNSEPRIASYVGIVAGQVPPEHYAALSAPLLSYGGNDVVPTFGGSMFEALMPDLLVPEEEWSPDLWRRNHPATVAAHRRWAADHGWEAWGWSPAAKPGEGYLEWGVDPVAWLERGYPSTLDGDPVVTPHAAAMALLHDPDAATACLARLEELGCYGPGGFVDVVALSSRRTAGRYLVLDQSMVLASLAHALGHPLRRWFVTPEVEAVLRPVLAARGWPDESERMPGRSA